MIVQIWLNLLSFIVYFIVKIDEKYCTYRI